MIPKEIASQLVRLKEKAKTYSSINRSYKIDEIRSDVTNINDGISDLNSKVDNILINGIILNFNIDNWFEEFKDKTEFTEPNPMVVYQEELQIIERQKLERLKRIEEDKLEKEILSEGNFNIKIELEFKRLCYFGPDDIDYLDELLDYGIDITKFKFIDSSTLKASGRSIEFIDHLKSRRLKF